MSKFLFYFEPHPIRNQFIEFTGVVDYWKNFFLTDSGHQMMLFANQPTLVAILQRYPELRRNFIYPSDEDNEFIEAQAGEWDSDAIMKWQQIMDGKGDTFNRYCTLIKNLHKEFPFDYIINWGTNKAVKQTAKELKAGFVNMELGCCRLPFCNTLVADPWGVNGSSVFSQSDITDFETITGRDKDSDLFNYGRENISEIYSSHFTLAPSSLRTIIGKEKIAFIPLQLYDDANLIQYSPYNEVINVLQDILPKLSEKGYFCIIKEHPASCFRKGSDDANQKAKKYASQFDNVLWVGKEYKQVSNIFWFHISEVIITVNSSTGFESLFYDKPLIVLGDAVYKINNVFPTLEDYLNCRFEQQAYLLNIAKIRKFFMEYYLISEEKAKDTAGLISRLISIGEMSKENLTPKEILERFVKI